MGAADAAEGNLIRRESEAGAGKSGIQQDGFRSSFLGQTQRAAFDP